VKRNPAAAAAVQRAMRSVSGIRQVEANPLTGSVVLYYNPASTTPSALLAALRQAGFPPDVRPAEARPTAATTQISHRLARKAAQAIATTVLEAAIERGVLMLIAALV
jgi:Cu+-exporting ATPase